MAYRSVVTLSRRESEVAELVGDGLTNREIATRLFISERTVEGHVAQICSKLGFRSRVQIATWLADSSSLPSARSGARQFRVVALPARVPWWLLATMAAGTPLPILAALYPWTGSPASTPIPLRVLLTVLALLFLVIPIIALLGLLARRSWAAPLAIRGLLATGSLVLLVATISLAASFLSGPPFRAADVVELSYAIAVLPLLLIHVLAGALSFRNTGTSRWLTTMAAVFWILRYGYGLSLSALVLWLLWGNPETRGRASR